MKEVRVFKHSDGFWYIDGFTHPLFMGELSPALREAAYMAGMLELDVVVEWEML